jgi:phosphodiesterase/alkaline phosphatase D-like protein
MEHIKYLSANNRNWDGNPASRARMLDLLSKQQIWDNNLWIAGDMHFTVVSDIFSFDDSKKETLLDYDRANFEGKRFGMEFLPASVSRGNLDEKVWQYTGWQTHSVLNEWLSSFVQNSISIMNPQYRYFDGSRHGYGLFTFSQTQTAVQIRYFSILDPDQPVEIGYSGVFSASLNAI